MELESRDREFAEGLCRQALMVALFAQALHLLWRNDRWVHTEPYAERCWAQLTLIHGGPPWTRVRDFIRELWLTDC
jgi:hypothetical protein